MSSLLASPPPSRLSMATSPTPESLILPMTSRSGGGGRRFASNRIAHSPRGPQPLPGRTIPSRVGIDELGDVDRAILAPPPQPGADGDEAMRGLLGSSLLSANSLTVHVAVGAAAGATTAASTQANAPSPIQNSPIVPSPQQSPPPQLQSKGPSPAQLPVAGGEISNGGGGSGSVAIIGSVVSVVVVLALVGIIWGYLAKRNPKSKFWSCFGYCNSIVRPYSTINEDWKPPGAGSRRNSISQHPEPSKAFTYKQLRDATGGFSPSNLLGEGGFGQVYKGIIDGNLVAVKMLKIGSKQGEREFRAEVDSISRVHHRHLVSLVGYCSSDIHRLLVYKFVPNGTLEEALHGEGKPCMNWATRMNIALGTARGLAYLHEDCIPRIIHRDIKGSNILLDEQFEAQVADFGLAKLADATQTHLTTRVMGTFGYVAPEYAMSGKLTDKSDVYSFGVVLLELITGKGPVDSTLLTVEGDSSLVEWARPLLTQALETRNVSAVVDPNLKGMYDEEEMFRMVEVAATCVRHSSPKRPKMVEALRGLAAQDGDLHQGVLAGYSKEFAGEEANEQMREFRKAVYTSSTTQSWTSSDTKSSSRGIQSTSSNEFGYSSQELHPVTSAPTVQLEMELLTA
ncbi:unnamed protein product [Calypogeia fissa]